MQKSARCGRRNFWDDSGIFAGRVLLDLLADALLTEFDAHSLNPNASSSKACGECHPQGVNRDAWPLPD